MSRNKSLQSELVSKITEMTVKLLFDVTDVTNFIVIESTLNVRFMYKMRQVHVTKGSRKKCIKSQQHIVKFFLTLKNSLLKLCSLFAMNQQNRHQIVIYSTNTTTTAVRCWFEYFNWKFSKFKWCLQQVASKSETRSFEKKLMIIE